MSEGEKLDIWPPIRLVLMGVICLAGIIFLPNSWWGLVVKVLLAVWLVGVVAGSFGALWDRYETMGAFVVFQLLAAAAIMLFSHIFWVTLIAILVIILGWATMLSHIRKSVHK